MIEVVLNEPDDFLKVRETLTRIGVASRKERKLYQFCCYLCTSKGKYYIVHFKELFALDGKAYQDQQTMIFRDAIASLSCCVIGDYSRLYLQRKVETLAPLNQIKVISFKEKGEDS